MADVKWIKITTDIFDDEKILLIESLPDAYSIIVCWFKLLCMAGKQNNSGVFLMGKIAYTDKMLATIFRMKEATVQLALRTFEEFGMIEIIDGVITIPNWNKHQSLDAYEKRKERDRLYQAEKRAALKQLIDKSSDESSDKSSDVGSLEGDKTEKKIRSDKNNDVGTAGNLPAVLTITLNDHSEYPITEKDVFEWRELYPAVDIMQELRKMRGWCDANPTKRKTARRIRSFIVRWLASEQDRGARPVAGTQPPHNAVVARNAQYEQHGQISEMGYEAIKRTLGSASKLEKRNAQYEQHGVVSDMGMADIQRLLDRRANTE